MGSLGLSRTAASSGKQVLLPDFLALARFARGAGRTRYSFRGRLLKGGAALDARAHRAIAEVQADDAFRLGLRHVADEYRGRVFATNESLVWATMMLSMLGAGLASQHVTPRVIGAWSGVLSSMTAVYWIWAWRQGMLQEPSRAVADERDLEVRVRPPA